MVFEEEHELSKHLENECNEPNKDEKQDQQQVASIDWENLECLKCGKRWPNVRGVKRHMALTFSCVKTLSPEMENEVQNKFNILRSDKKCDKCEKYFKRPLLLLQHLRRNLENKVCGQPNFPKEIPVQKQIRKKSCDDCGKKFEHPKNLKFHVERAVCTRKKTTHKCNKCGKIFPNEKQLSGHMNRKVSCVSPKKHSIASFLR